MTISGQRAGILAWRQELAALGAGSAVGAAVCAIVARNRYDALSDHSRPLQQAVQLKNAGENWQTASLVLSGTAVIGLTVGLVGFFTRSSRDHSVGVSAGLLRDGGMIAIVGDLP